MYLCRRIFMFKQWIMTMLYSDKKQYYSENIVKQLQFPITEVEWKATVPDNVILLEQLTMEYFGDKTFKYKIWYSGQSYKKMSYDEIIMYFEERPKIPWLWIGGSNGVAIQDRSRELEPYILAGNLITLQLLSEIDKSISSWSYLCPETFEKLDFPVNGIIIKSDDNSRMENSSKEM